MSLDLIDEIKAHADTNELVKVNFLDEHGDFVQPEAAHLVELYFVDGTEYTITPGDFAMFDDYSFKLRPAELHS